MNIFSKKKKWFLIGIIFVFGVFFLLFFFTTPTHERDWEFGQDRLPYAMISEQKIFLHNIRDNTPNTSGHYIEKEYQVSDIQSVDFFLSGFSKFEGIAHTLLSFGFQNGEYITVSVEARREKDEKYSPFWGTFNQYELLYVMGTERDLIGSRLKEKNEQVFLHRTSFSPLQAQAIFLDILKRINLLQQNPEFYNTFSNNCTTNLIHHFEVGGNIQIPYSYSFFLPGYLDSFLYKQKILKTDVPVEDFQNKARIDQKAKDIFPEDPDFSRRIRDL
jgi:hypothetical protein